MEKKDNLLTIPAAIVIAGVIVAGALIYIKHPTPASSPVSAQTATINLASVTTDDHIRGIPTAKVTIIEFSDLECPFCKMFHATMQQVMNNYGKKGDVAWVYRHFPLNIHPKAQKEAEAAECVFAQGGDVAFWKFIDGVFAITPSNNQLDPAKLPTIAGSVGVDVDQFNTCLSSGATAAKITNNYQDGLRVGIGSVPDSGTPYSIIIDKKGNKIPISGAQPYEVVSQLIDAILADN